MLLARCIVVYIARDQNFSGLLLQRGSMCTICVQELREVMYILTASGKTREK